MHDVAKAAGVAASTVSRAFGDPGRVSAATADHVRRVAAELGYRAGPPGPRLRIGQTAMLALVVSDVTNPFYTEIIRGAEAAASAAGYTLVLIDTQESEQVERDGLERALPTIEGVILAGTRLSDAAIRDVAQQRPVVILNRDVPGVPGIVLDNAQGARATVEHLKHLGHDTFTYLAGPAASWVDGVRWHSLRTAAHDLGCTAQRRGPFVPTVAGGHEAAAALPWPPPSAIVAYNDQLAIGLMLTLQRRGLGIPRDVRIIGYDNIHLAHMVSPPLTTIAAPLRQQGHAAVSLLLATRDTPRPAPANPVTLPVQLVIRASTGQPHGTHV